MSASAPGLMKRGRPARPGVRVASVAEASAAARAGIRPGARILTVSGRPAEDLLDLHFLTSRSRFSLRWEESGGRERLCAFRLAEGERLGIHPEPIRVRRCRNRCIFCFVHQLPKGLRRALYVKDEDVRLSFLHGQYVTFSDLTEEEIRKIVRYRLSPLYVSIHTTDAALRRRMLGNPRARDILAVMRRLTGAGLELHGQIVVCPGINDGRELYRSLLDLSALRPGLRTVAVVPVGLTSHRAGLPPLRPVTRDEARETLDLLRSLRHRWAGVDEEPFAVAADEYYLIAGWAVPGRRAYGSFAQLGNGVGLVRRFLDESAALFRRRRWPPGASGGGVVTGKSAAGLVSRFLEEFSRRAGARFHLFPVPNRLMGESVTVTGLLGGNDIVSAVAGKVRGKLFIPSVTLREAGDLFLDGVSPAEISRKTGSEIRIFEATPRGFHDAVYSAKGPLHR
jgi:putative radical SAM enzyme (TIGR03279 family)